MNLMWYYIFMKVINNTNINDLIIYSKKKLGIYELLYKKHRILYWSAIFLTCMTGISLLAYIILVIYYKRDILEAFFCIFCTSNALIAFCLTKVLEHKTGGTNLNIQDKRLRHLKRYYCEKGYNSKEIKKINILLSKRIEKLTDQKTTFLVILGILILPIWESFISEYFTDFDSNRIFKMLIVCSIISIILAWLIKFCNNLIYLYEENIYIINNVSIIENLIYLNEYIIEEREEQTPNGRRK